MGQTTPGSGRDAAKMEAYMTPEKMPLVLKASGAACSLMLLFVGFSGIFTIGLHGLILHLYIIIFSVATLLAEVGDQLAEKVPQLNQALGPLKKNFPFICTIFGRACLYLFTASITLAYAYENLTHALTGLIALANAIGHGFIVLKKPELVGKDAGLGLAAQDSAKSNAEGEEVPPSV